MSHLQVDRHTLDNGLRVVLNPDTSVPTVSVCVTYDVGSRVESRGESGFAHLFEHLMFQGSRNVPKGDHFRLLRAAAGRANGSTNKDRTDYYETLPRGGLALALWLEADRMRSLALNEANLENQRAVVLEEYRMRYANTAYALGRLRLYQMVYQGYWPYQHPTIGDMQDLESAKLSWAKRFKHEHYRPNRAVVTVSGHFDPRQALELVTRYFGSISPAGGPAAPPPSSLEARQTSERLVVMEDTNAKTPGVFYGWLIPPAGTSEHRALELLAEVLAGGSSSRLHQRLVMDKATASQVRTWTGRARGPDVFAVWTKVATGHSVDDNQDWLDQELKSLRGSGPSDSEVARAKARLRRRWLARTEKTVDRARLLGDFEVSFGDASALSREWRHYQALTTRDLQSVAASLLLDTHRTIVEVYPPGWVRDIGPTIVTQTHVVKKGESLIGIARRYGSSAEAIAKANRISVKKPIFPGQKLFVTLGQGARRVITKTHTVKKGDNLISIAKRYGTTVAAITKENKISTKKPIIIGQKLNITLDVSGKRGGTAKPSKAPKGDESPKQRSSSSKKRSSGARKKQK